MKGPTGLRESDVRLQSVTKRFGDVVAVDDLTVSVHRREFFSLLGPSGCGKTTTLRIVGGFEEPSAGTVWIGDEDVTDRPPYRRAVNTVFQSYALFPHLDVFENVAFGLRRRGVAPGEVREQVGAMLDLVQLPGYERRKPAQLSGGQQQRVALARALINQPRVLLLDEPLGALDLKLRKQMQLELKRIQTEVGITFVYVTHDQDEAMTMSDRIAVMRAGRIEQLGPPADLYERPRTEFVAGFLGVSNLLDADVASRANGTLTLRLRDGTPVHASAAAAGSLNGATTTRVGVRPEKLRIRLADAGAAPGAGTQNAIEGTIVDASYIGVSTQYLVETGDGQRLTVYAQNLDTTGA
ncbi:MAG: ABC transporter ATP-binding protein, partial [Chloroflexota bacterium]|nr:ABC transporter ATP-binding protein [Chloroflexota bacterium]